MNFEEYISEASANIVSSKDSDAMIKNNEDRVGMPILSLNDTEIKNSVVLSSNTYAYKDAGGQTTIETIDFITGKSTAVSFSREELGVLAKNIKTIT